LLKPKRSTKATTAHTILAAASTPPTSQFHEIVIESTFFAVFCVAGWCLILFFLSRTSTVKVDDFAFFFGVPEMTPECLLSFSPLGSFADPLASLQV
jgi:hypothetical protein